MKWFRQIFAVTNMNLLSITQRFGSSLVVIVGIAGSVAVMVSLLAMASGLQSTVEGTGESDRAMILRSGSNSELSSVISIEEANVLSNAPGLEEYEGKPMIAFEVYTVVDLMKKGAEDTSNLPLRGVDSMSFAVRPETKIIKGRNFELGRSELIVGKGAYDQYQGLEIGDEVVLRNSAWTVVGVFSTDGDIHESELWADVKVTQSAFLSLIHI